MNKEEISKLQEVALESFKAQWEALFGRKLAYGASKMPREKWAPCMVSALIAVGAIESEAQAVKALAALDSAIGNSSQLGAELVKAKWLEVEEPAQAAFSFAAMIAKKASEAVK